LPRATAYDGEPSPRNRAMKRLLLALALVSGFALPVVAPQAAEAKLEAGDPAENKAVRVVAMQFLQEIDNNRVGNTWPMVGNYLRGILTRAEWEKGIVDARASRDPASRDLIGAFFTRELDDSRDGHFFIVAYVSRFGANWYQERVILSLQGTQWKVEGYWMLPSDKDGNQLKTD
jgi:hypothetical protein